MNALKSLVTKLNAQTIVVLAIAVGLLAFLFASTNAQSSEAFVESTDAVSESLTCVETLPEVTYLGEYPGEYELPAGFDTFVVKRRNPFRFDVESGAAQNGLQVYTTSDRERVWACAGDCTFSAYKSAPVDFGSVSAGQHIEMIVLDDDGLIPDNDQRRNWWAANDPMVQHQVVEDQQLTEFIDFTVPFEANWYFYAADSVGIVTKCVEPLPTPTPIETATAVATATPTIEPTVTVTPTATPTVEATVTATPTATSTSTSTPLATVTNSVAPTQTPTNAPTNTPTDAPTSIPTSTPPVAGSESTATPTPIPTAVHPPTAIELVRMNSNLRNGQVVVSWETSAEIDTLGFNIWRSANGSRQSALQLTESLIPSRGRTDAGAAYEYVDTTAQADTHYTYWVDEVELNGATSMVGSTRTEFVGYFYLPFTSK